MDAAQAKASVSAFVESLGLRPMDTGPLFMARTPEHVCLLSLGLLKHSVKHTNFAIGVNLLDPATHRPTTHCARLPWQRQSPG